MNLNELQELAISTAKEAGDFLNKSKPEKILFLSKTKFSLYLLVFRYNSLYVIKIYIGP